jgi:hypothetical protein
MRGSCELVVNQANTLVHQQRIVRAWIAVNERQPRARIAESRRQTLQLARGRSTAEPVCDQFGILLDTPPQAAAGPVRAKNGLQRLMMGVEAADGIRVQAAQRGRIQLQGVLSLSGRSLEKRVDQRGEMSAEILEDHDATGNIAGQQRRAMTTTGSACGKKGAGDPLLRQA